MTPVAPAIANAVADAIGVRVFEMPITPERVVMAMKRRDAAGRDVRQAVPESSPGAEPPRVRAVDGGDPPLARYVRILETVAAARAGLTLTEIATELELKPGTVHRLVRGLTALGLLGNAAGSKRYVSGPRLLNLLYLNLDPTGYAAFAQPTLDGLVAALGETAHLARLNGDFAESVLMKQPLGSNRAYVQPGRQLPLHAAASGKALLAFQTSVHHRLPGAAAHPVHGADQGRAGGGPPGDRSDPERRHRDLRQRARRRRAELRTPGAGAGGSVLYSVGITGLADRFRATSRELIREMLSAAATELGRALGFRG